MLIPQLIHTGFHLVAVDWQTVVASSILIDECVFLGAVYANMKKTEAK